MKQNFFLLTTLILGVLRTQAKPVQRDVEQTSSANTVDQSVVKYLDPSGQINYADLYADTAAKPITIPILASGTATAAVQTASLAASASVGATQSLVTVTASAQPTGNAPQRRSVFERIQSNVNWIRRDGTPHFQGNATQINDAIFAFTDESGQVQYQNIAANAPASSAIVTITSSSAVITSTVSVGAAQSTGSPSSRRNVRRDVQPEWNPSSCPNPGQSKGVDVSGMTPQDFSGNSWISSLYSQNAPTPDGFSKVYVGADGIPIGTTTSITQAITSLDSYDVGACKSACDYYNCQAFSVFAVRDTTVDMDNVDLSKCNNPPGILLFNCAVYGSSITKDMINERGQMKGDYFLTSIAAANGYVRSSIDKEIQGYTNTVYNGGTTSDGNTAPYLIDIYNPNQNSDVIGYAPDLCAARCSGNDACQGFDASETLADGNFIGTQCLLYNKPIGVEDANNAGQWGNDGKWYSFQPSVFYTKNLPDPPSFTGASCSLDTPSRTYTCSYQPGDAFAGLTSTFVPPCSGTMSVEMAGARGGNDFNNGYSCPGWTVSSAVKVANNAEIQKGTSFDVVLGGDGYSPYYQGRSDGGFNGGGSGGRYDDDDFTNRYLAAAGGGGYSSISYQGTDLVIAGGGGGNGFDYGQAGVGTLGDNYVSSGHTGGSGSNGYPTGGGGGGGLLGGAAGSNGLGGNNGQNLADQNLGLNNIPGSPSYAKISFTCSS